MSSLKTLAVELILIDTLKSYELHKPFGMCF